MITSSSVFSRIPLLVAALIIALLAACATQPKPAVETESASASIDEQKAAQQVALKARPDQLVLKRKVAIGRFSNETLQGRSLLRDDFDDPLGKQVSDMLSQRLIESGRFLVLERPDIERVLSESDMAGTDLNLVGVDSLIMGSLVEFARKTTGTKGFWSKTKKQTAAAKVALRLVDTRNGLAYFSATGAGEASTETGEVAFAGSTAAYNATINDQALANAVSDVVDDIIRNLSNRPWSTNILSVDGDTIYISGGESQGIRNGQQFDIEKSGKKVKSPQTGFYIALPGEKIATIKVTSTFGDSDINEGAMATLTSGSLSDYDISLLKVTEHADK